MLQSCASLNSDISADIYYQKDLIIRIDNQRFEGIATLPDQSVYSFEFESKGKIDLFTIKSCHFYEVITPDRVIKQKKIEYVYYPTKFERQQSMCPLVINAYEKNMGRHSFAQIDFNRPMYSAIAQIDCNGFTMNKKGTYLCQSGEGLYQQITFDKESVFVTNCQDTITKQGLSYKIKLNKGICIYTFKTNGALFRLTTFGFEKTLIY